MTDNKALKKPGVVIRERPKKGNRKIRAVYACIEPVDTLTFDKNIFLQQRVALFDDFT